MKTRETNSQMSPKPTKEVAVYFSWLEHAPVLSGAKLTYKKPLHCMEEAWKER